MGVLWWVFPRVFGGFPREALVCLKGFPRFLAVFSKGKPKKKKEAADPSWWFSKEKDTPKCIQAGECHGQHKILGVRMAMGTPERGT